MKDEDVRIEINGAHSNAPAERRYDAIAIVFGGLAFLALAYLVRPILSPFIILLVLYLVLAPFREYRAARKLMLAAFVLFAVWFFITLSGLLVPFILGAILAYLFNPLVSRLHERKHMHRTWSSLIIVLLFCGLLVAAGWIFIPSLVAQTRAFIARLTIFVRENASTFDERHLRNILISIGIPASLVDQIIIAQAAPQLRKVVAFVPQLVFELVAGLPKFLERTLNLIIVPVAMFYFLKDWPKIGPLIDQLFPAKDPKLRSETVADVDRVIYAYVRGQATVATLIGILGAIAYTVLGIPYAGLLGVILAVSDLIPIAGMIFSMFIVELVIFLTMELNFAVIASGVLVIAALHFLEVYIIGPRIIGPRVGVPPILMILALLIFGYFLGFLGLLIAVPSTAVIILFVEEYRKNQRILLEKAPSLPKESVGGG
jgi:predicted PurR-regulated permease PerM